MKIVIECDPRKFKSDFYDSETSVKLEILRAVDVTDCCRRITEGHKMHFLFTQPTTGHRLVKFIEAGPGGAESGGSGVHICFGVDNHPERISTFEVWANRYMGITTAELLELVQKLAPPVTP